MKKSCEKQRNGILPVFDGNSRFARWIRELGLSASICRSAVHVAPADSYLIDFADINVFGTGTAY